MVLSSINDFPKIKPFRQLSPQAIILFPAVFYSPGYFYYFDQHNKIYSFVNILQNGSLQKPTRQNQSPRDRLVKAPDLRGIRYVRLAQIHGGRPHRPPQV